MIFLSPRLWAMNAWVYSAEVVVLCVFFPSTCVSFSYILTFHQGPCHVRCIYVPSSQGRKWDMFSAAYIEAHMSWRWVYGIWGIVGTGLTVIYVVLVPETRGGVILSARAQRARQAGHKGAWAIHEKLGRRSAKQILRETVLRPASNSPSRSIL